MLLRCHLIALLLPLVAAEVRHLGATETGEVPPRSQQPANTG